MENLGSQFQDANLANLDYLLKQIEKESQKDSKFQQLKTILTRYSDPKAVGEMNIKQLEQIIKIADAFFSTNFKEKLNQHKEAIESLRNARKQRVLKDFENFLSKFDVNSQKELFFNHLTAVCSTDLTNDREKIAELLKSKLKSEHLIELLEIFGNMLINTADALRNEHIDGSFKEPLIQGYKRDFTLDQRKEFIDYHISVIDGASKVVHSLYWKTYAKKYFDLATKIDRKLIEMNQCRQLLLTTVPAHRSIIPEPKMEAETKERAGLAQVQGDNLDDLLQQIEKESQKDSKFKQLEKILNGYSDSKTVGKMNIAQLEQIVKIVDAFFLTGFEHELSSHKKAIELLKNTQKQKVIKQFEEFLPKFDVTSQKNSFFKHLTAVCSANLTNEDVKRIAAMLKNNVEDLFVLLVIFKNMLINTVDALRYEQIDGSFTEPLIEGYKSNFSLDQKREFINYHMRVMEGTMKVLKELTVLIFKQPYDDLRGEIDGKLLQFERWQREFPLTTLPDQRSISPKPKTAAVVAVPISQAAEAETKQRAGFKPISENRKFPSQAIKNKGFADLYTKYREKRESLESQLSSLYVDVQELFGPIDSFLSLQHPDPDLAEENGMTLGQIKEVDEKELMHKFPLVAYRYHVKKLRELMAQENPDMEQFRDVYCEIFKSPFKDPELQVELEDSPVVAKFEAILNVTPDQANPNYAYVDEVVKTYPSEVVKKFEDLCPAVKFRSLVKELRELMTKADTDEEKFKDLLTKILETNFKDDQLTSELMNSKYQELANKTAEEFEKRAL